MRKVLRFGDKIADEVAHLPCGALSGPLHLRSYRLICRVVRVVCCEYFHFFRTAFANLQKEFFYV